MTANVIASAQCERTLNGLCGRGNEVSTIQLRDGTEGEFIAKLDSFAV